ncbi:hypothetical protein [Citrobacter amalonaticus]
MLAALKETRHNQYAMDNEENSRIMRILTLPGN